MGGLERKSGSGLRVSRSSDGFDWYDVCDHKVPFVRKVGAAMMQSARSEMLAALFERRVTPLADLSTQAGTLADACHDMAVRFEAGGTLLVFGNGGSSTDAQHVAVEFVHPVIMGKRALPALSLTGDVATVTGVASADGMAEIFAHQIRVLGRPDDIALGISTDGNCDSVAAGLRAARARGLLTVALTGGTGGAIRRENVADHLITVASDDPQVVKEAHVTAYHLLWELVHVFLERPGVLTSARTRAATS
jgi:D-sedoheptulose 7-phosphate isomerase